MRQRELAALLRAVADLLDEMTSDNMRELVEGKLQLVLEDIAEENAQKENERVTRSQKIDIKYVMDRIESTKSIEEGLAVLREEGVDRHRKQLEELAKNYDVGIRKSEPLVEFSRRIINAVVGSKLQAEITQNLSLTRTAREENRK